MMNSFRYKAVSHAGQMIEGQMEAASEQDVIARLQAQQQWPLQIEIKQRFADRFMAALSWRPGMSTSGLMQFTQLLATLVEAGIPIPEALTLVGEHANTSRIQAVTQALHQHLNEGLSLSQAMQKEVRDFPSTYRASLAAGENSGELALVLGRLATYLQKRIEVTQQIKAALIYPLIILLVAMGVIGMLLVYVVPKVMDVLNQGGAELPPLTKAVMYLNQLLQQYGTYLPLGAGVLLLGFMLVLRQQRLRLYLHACLLKIPILKAWLQTSVAIYFCRTLALLLASGVPVLEALADVAGGIGNDHYRQLVGKAARLISQGQSLHQALTQQALLPAVAMRLLASGEHGGQLPHMLDKASQLMEQQQQGAIKVGLALLEPLMMLFLGGLVLLIVMAVLMPIFDMNQLVV